MYKTIQKILIVSLLTMSLSSAYAMTKPGPDANPSNLSYSFYLYYDNGQLFADRDYEVNFDVIEEAFNPQSVDDTTAFRVDLFNLQSNVVQTFKFDPKNGDPNFSKGKIVVKAPYVSDGLKAQFYDAQGSQLVTIFINTASICNDDGACNSAAGENNKTCPNDCTPPQATTVPVIPTEESPGFFSTLDTTTLLIYGAGAIGILVLAWFGWRWWKKKRSESFLPPPPPPTPPTPTPILPQ